MSKFSLLHLIFIALLVSFFSNITLAQELISTNNETILVDFPDTITFKVEATGPTTINKASLIYGTNGRSCQSVGSKNTIDFEPEQSVELEWEWELKRSGSIPPGAEIWWEWEIEDESGNILKTERQTHLVDDERFAWRSVKADGIVVNWVTGDKKFGESILQIADESLNLIAQDMGVSRPETIHLWVYPSSDDVQESLVYSPEWAGGVAFPEYGITILGIEPDQNDWKSQVIPHELAHLVIGELMFNCYGVGLPTWLNEGLAVYAENDISARDLSQFQKALEAEELLPLTLLEAGFSAYGSSASVSYTQSYIIVKYLIDQYGADKMLELLSTVSSGKRIDTALEAVYGFDTAGLDAEWRRTTGFEATPTSEADALAAEETSTPIPTLSLANPLEGLATATPAPPTVAPATATTEPTATAIPTDTPAPTEVEIALVATVVIEDEPEESLQEEASPNANNTVWLILGAIFIGLSLIIIYFLRNRRS